jgi:hypothetical protein
VLAYLLSLSSSSSIAKNIFKKEILNYNLALTKNEILPFVATWMNLEDIMLSEINQTQNDIDGVILCCVESKNTIRFIS